MNRKLIFLSVAAASFLMLPACSKAPEKQAGAGAETKKAEAKPPEAVAARSAFFEMYKPAREWAPDVLTLTVKSVEVPGVKNEEGRAGAWTAVFVSPSRKEARTFTYSVVTGGDFRKGINISDKQTWGGPTPTSKAFTNAEFSVNSDAAYKAAQVKAAAWLKTNPKAPFTMTLGSIARFPGPVWYILWGTTKSGFAAYVNATTGELVTR